MAITQTKFQMSNLTQKQEIFDQNFCDGPTNGQTNGQNR